MAKINPEERDKDPEQTEALRAQLTKFFADNAVKPAGIKNRTARTFAGKVCKDAAAQIDEILATAQGKTELWHTMRPYHEAEDKLFILRFAESQSCAEVDAMAPGAALWLRKYIMADQPRDIPALVQFLERLNEPKVRDRLRDALNDQRPPFRELMDQSGWHSVIIDALEVFEEPRQELHRKEDAAAASELDVLAELSQPAPLKSIFHPIDPITQVLPGKLNKTTGRIEPVVNAPAFNLTMSNKPPIKAYLAVTLPPEYDTITPQEMPILNAAMTVINHCWEIGTRVFTAEMVCRVMDGRTDTKTIRQKELDEVTQAIEKFRAVKIKSNLTQYVKLRNENSKREDKFRDPFTGKELKSLVFDGYLLTLEGTDYTTADDETHAYIITAWPDVMKLGMMTGMCIRADYSVVTIKETKNGKALDAKVKLSGNRRTIRDYLIKRIGVMKSEARESRRILFETLYRECGLQDLPRDKKGNARDFVFQCLDYWQAIGYIAGYTIGKNGAAYRHVEISLKKGNLKEIAQSEKEEKT